MSDEINWLSAWLAGLISFLSPCVLPLVPAYLSYLTGLQIQTQAMPEEKRPLRRSLLLASAFVAGFATVFISLGATATFFGHWLSSQAFWLQKVAGIVVIILGIHMLGFIRIPFLMQEQRFQVRLKKINLIGVYFVGWLFAFGWTPCIGPLLAGILTLAGTRETVGEGILLLTFYSLGLGIPFLLAALMWQRFIAWMRRFQKYLRWVEITAGLLLIGIGFTMLTNGMLQLASVLAVFNRFSL